MSSPFPWERNKIAAQQESSLDRMIKEMESAGFISKSEEKKIYKNGEAKVVLEEYRSALLYLDPDMPNQEWIIPGMAGKDEFGDAAFPIWDEWSQGGSKYNSREMKSRWASFGRREGITIATVFWMAQQNGWSKVLVDHNEPETPNFEINGYWTGWPEQPIEQKKTKAHKEIIIIDSEPEIIIPQKQEITFPQKLLKAPGLVGELLTFINDTALIPQPILNLGAAIAGAGTLMGRKVRGDTNLRTNFYIVCLAPSGSGKDHPRTVLKRLFHDGGLGNLELGVPASSAGLISGLRDRADGRGIIIWDEFGRALQQISSWKSGNHEKDIVTALVELFTSAQAVYTGKAYANHDGKNPLKPIDQPCLSIYGSSVPGRFYEALSSSETVDGFLSRWILLESKDYSIEDEERSYLFKNIPQRFIDICRYWKSQPFNCAPDGNLSDVTQVNPRVISCSKGAEKIFKEYSIEMRNKAIACELVGDNLGAIWARSAEHARRIALVCHEGDEISKEVAEYGKEFAFYISSFMANAVGDYVSSSELESHTKRVLRYIKERTKEQNTWVERSDYTRAFQGIQSKTRMEIIDALIERHEIVEHKSALTGRAGRPSVKFRAI